MILGETTEDRVTRLVTPQIWFAWHPVVIEDGRLVWLQMVLRYRVRYDVRNCSTLWSYELPYEGWDQ